MCESSYFYVNYFLFSFIHLFLTREERKEHVRTSFLSFSLRALLMSLEFSLQKSKKLNKVNVNHKKRTHITFESKMRHISLILSVICVSFLFSSIFIFQTFTLYDRFDWTQLASIAEDPRQKHVVVTLNKKVYIIDEVELLRFKDETETIVITDRIEAYRITEKKSNI